MAIVRAMDEVAWQAWVKTRPEVIQAMCAKLPPDRLYRIKSTGQRVTLHSYSEDGTVTVDITGQYNMLTFARQVFGIRSDDLEECDLPGSDEPVGALLTEEADIREFIDEIRPTILADRDASQANAGES